MPPEQCPHCGRFLKRAFVAGLQQASAACPGCGEELTSDAFGTSGQRPSGDERPRTAAVPVAEAPAVAGDGDEPEAVGSAAASATDAEAGGSTAPELVSDDPSVRPPDLEPTTVRGPDDVLHGWDTDAQMAGLWTDRRPFPTDTVIVAGAAVSGAVAGVVCARRRGSSVVAGALGGLAVGSLAAGIGRRIWQLEG